MHPNDQKIYMRGSPGFTLIELLIVLAIMGGILIMAVSAFNNVGKAHGLTAIGYEIEGVLEEAKAYAMARRTYVWVGFQKEGEDDLRIGIVASRNGEAQPGGRDTATAGADVLQIGRIKRFNNVRIEDLQDRVDGRSVTKFPPPDSSGVFSVGAGTNRLSMGVPLIQFDSTGEMRTVISPPPGLLLETRLQKVVEIGIQSSINNVVSNPGNYVAIRIGGLSGSISVHRP